MDVWLGVVLVLLNLVSFATGVAMRHRCLALSRQAVRDRQALKDERAARMRAEARARAVGGRNGVEPTIERINQ